MTEPTRLLYFVTEDWYFCSHRLALAVAAQEAGYEVTVLTRVAEHGDLIRSQGLRLLPIALSRQGMNPVRELRLMRRVVRAYRQVRPHLVHQVALKPILYGSLAARLVGVPYVVNALAGLGFLFSSERPRARLLRPLVKLGFHHLLRGEGNRVILQNPDDRDLLTGALRVPADRVRLIRGAGVDLNRFRPTSEPEGPPVVVLASRLLWDKGVGEFVEAARRLRTRNTQARFVLVGAPDPGNPSAIPQAVLAQWEKEGAVELWGHRTDMDRVFAQSHLVCLPSYREGLPKVLLEAAACGHPLVATNVPGCREVVRDGQNGLLVPAKDSAALAGALERLIGDAALRADFGARSHAIAEAGFGIERVIAQHLGLYREICPPANLNHRSTADTG